MPDNTGTSTIGRVRSSIRTTAEYSRAVTIGKEVITPVRDAASRLSEYTRESYIYRWLTKEPDPDVIIIDLRETYTVGPVIRLLDATITHIDPYWRESRLARLLHGIEQSGERFAESRLGQIFLRLLEPPEPPKNGDEERRE